MRNVLVASMVCASLSSAAAGSYCCRPVPSATPTHGPIRPKTQVGLPRSSDQQLLTSIDLAATTYDTDVIFWGREWNDPHFAGDKIDGIDRFYEGYGNSNYAKALAEYFQATQSRPLPSIAYRGHIIDANTQLRSRSEFSDNLAVRAEICRQYRSHALDIKPFESYIAVYTASKPPGGGACAIRGEAYCGNDSLSAFGYSLVYNLDGVSSCDPKDRKTGHSQGLAAVANASARALNKVETDFAFTEFQDLSGKEVDDKCAWTFNVPYVTFTNGSIWKLQGLWSNNAYQAGAGYPNWFGQKGCVDGR